MSKSNPLLRETIVFLERQKAPVWRYASRSLSAGSSRGIEVNVGHISRTAEANSAVLVAGKVLGSGTLEKKVVVGAFSFSAAAKKKITEAGGAALGIQDLVKRYPDGTGVKIVN